MKRIKELAAGTFLDTGSVQLNAPAVFILPDHSVMRTSPVVRSFISSGYVEIETINTVYVIKGAANVL